MTRQNDSLCIEFILVQLYFVLAYGEWRVLVEMPDYNIYHGWVCVLVSYLWHITGLLQFNLEVTLSNKPLKC